MDEEGRLNHGACHDSIGGCSTFETHLTCQGCAYLRTWTSVRTNGVLEHLFFHLLYSTSIFRSIASIAISCFVPFVGLSIALRMARAATGSDGNAFG